jgi:hypothetical protein
LKGPGTRWSDQYDGDEDYRELLKIEREILMERQQDILEKLEMAG